MPNFSDGYGGGSGTGGGGMYGGAGGSAGSGKAEVLGKEGKGFYFESRTDVYADFLNVKRIFSPRHIGSDSVAFILLLLNSVKHLLILNTSSSHLPSHFGSFVAS